MRVPESIRELRTICQRSPQWQVHQPWAFLQIRRASIYLTWILLHLPVTPNGVSLLGIASGIVASVLFGGMHFIAGSIALQFAILCDFSDGEVSRYRKQQSKQGSYLDKVYHFTVQPSVFAGVTIGAYRVHPSLWVLVAGFVATICVAAFVMVVAYANELAVWKHARKLLDKISASLVANTSNPSVLTDILGPLSSPTTVGATVGSLSGVKDSSLARRISEMSSLWDFPYIFFVLTASVIAWLLVPELRIGELAVSPLDVVLLFYAVTYPCWIALYLFYVLATQSVERGYLAFAGDLSLLLSRVAQVASDSAGSSHAGAPPVLTRAAERDRSH